MPSTSKKQHNFMAAIAANPKFAKKAGVAQSVGAEFIKADKGRKFLKGGEMANTSRMNRLEELGRVDSERAKTTKGKSNLASEKKRIVSELSFMKKKGAPKSMVKHEEAEAKGMKKGGCAKYARGGGIETKGKTKGTMVKMAMGGACMKKSGRGR